MGDNCILYDWFTCSFVGVDYYDLTRVLGMDQVKWTLQKTGSRLKYGHRLAFDGISIHYTDPDDHVHQVGICLEMSGQGCRDFETFGLGDWQRLFEFVALADGHITRLDIAYDDFTGVLPIRTMYDQADRFEFTARTQKVQLIKQSEDADPAHAGLSICHGSKSSEVFVRCYDKRVERHAWDEYDHWVRFEIQLRGSNACGFVHARGSIGDKFRGVVANYINYRDAVPGDSNKRRWPLSSWWSEFLEHAAAISVHDTRDVEYNKLRLDMHIYDSNHNAIKAEILADGLPVFLGKIFHDRAELPDKYSRILEASKNSDEILRILSAETSGVQVLSVAGQIGDYTEAQAINIDKVS